MVKNRASQQMASQEVFKLKWRGGGVFKKGKILRQVICKGGSIQMCKSRS